jgi:ankyrin repeat protein
MENQSSVFCDENQIDILRQVFIITAQNGYKEEVFQTRYICSVFYNEEELFDTLANYEINKTTSLHAYAICDAIKSGDNARALKLISRIALPVTDGEMINPNKIYYTFIKYVGVYISAIKHGNIEILDKMLTFPVSEKKKYALFFSSIHEKSIPVIKYFISKNYDLNYQLMEPFIIGVIDKKVIKTPLLIGVLSRNFEIVQLLVENGAVSWITPFEIYYNQVEFRSISPILISCLSKNHEIFDYLLINSNIIHLDEIITTLCRQEDIKLLKTVIEKYNKLLQDKGEPQDALIIPDNAFIISSKKKNMDIFNYLFDNFKMSLHARNETIEILCDYNKHDILDKVLIKYPGYIYDFILTVACRNSSEEIVACLINHGVDINHNINGTTVLTKIAERNFIGVAQMLLDRKIDINHQSDRGWSALMMAVTTGKIEMVQFLMENGADKSLKNNMGRDVLEMAKFRNHVKIIEILTKY